MHDIDRTQLEYNQALENYEHEQFEYGETEWSGETGVLNEAETMQLAAELLEVSNEAELDQFLGDLIKKAGSAVGTFVKSPVGQQLGGILKGAAKNALPIIGSAVGGHFFGDKGAKYGGRTASAIGTMFGLELEGLSMEDQEFEVAKRFVQFAAKAAQNAALAPPSAHPKTLANHAAAAAARQLAPGLIAGGAALSPGKHCPTCGSRSSGRWYRRGNKIILIGA